MGVGVGNLYIPKTGDAEKEAAAKKFIDFATGPDYRKYLAESHQFPVLKGFPVPKGVAKPLVEANHWFLTDSVPQYQQTLQAAYGPFETFLQEMIAGKTDAKGVAQQLQDEFEKSLASSYLDIMFAGGSATSPDYAAGRNAYNKIYGPQSLSPALIAKKLKETTK